MEQGLQLMAARQELGQLKHQLQDASYWLAQVAARLAATEEFMSWLMEQDASSAEIYSPGKPRKNIEEKSDIELAKMFISEQGR